MIILLCFSFIFKCSAHVRLKGLRYVFEERSARFVCHDFPVEQSTFAHIHDLAAVGEKERDVRQRLFGSNVMLVPVPSYLELVVDELLHPFYVFQVKKKRRNDYAVQS